MTYLVPKLRLLLRAEVLRGRLAVRSLTVRAVIYAVAALFGGLGVVMLVAAVFLLLAEHLGPIYGAAVTGFGLCVLAVLMVLVARPLSRGRKTALAEDLEQTIRAEVMNDLQATEAQARSLQQSVSGAASAARGPLAFAAVAIGLLVSLSPRLRSLLSSLLR